MIGNRGIFDINYAETLVNVSVSTDVRKLNVSSRSAMRFVTFSSIQFDLADLLPYFKKSMTIYTGNDNSFVAFTNDQEPMCGFISYVLLHDLETCHKGSFRFQVDHQESP